LLAGPIGGGRGAGTTGGKRAAARSANAASPTAGQTPRSGDDPLFRRLREWRLDTAREQSVPAYVVFSDATLQAIADTRPGSRAELAGIPGIGAVKLDRYGAAVLELCAGAAPASAEGNVGASARRSTDTGGNSGIADGRGDQPGEAPAVR
jgi:DNA helicase-2/ATP-dependent DNA helicase PcrA